MNSSAMSVIVRPHYKPACYLRSARMPRMAKLSWLFFLLAGTFISLILPLGEGFDEPWHLSYIQDVAQTGKFPSGPRSHLSVELERFLDLHPMGWRLHDIFPNLRTEEEYWQRPEEQRLADDAAIRRLSFSGSYVEAGSSFTE